MAHMGIIGQMEVPLFYLHGNLEIIGIICYTSAFEFLLIKMTFTPHTKFQNS